MHFLQDGHWQTNELNIFCDFTKYLYTKAGCKWATFIEERHNRSDIPQKIVAGIIYISRKYAKAIRFFMYVHFASSQYVLTSSPLSPH